MQIRIQLVLLDNQGLTIPRLAPEVVRFYKRMLCHIHSTHKKGFIRTMKPFLLVVSV